MQYYRKIEKSKIARRGHSTTDALLFMLQAIYEAVACAVLGARVFFVDRAWSGREHKASFKSVNIEIKQSGSTIRS